MNRAGRTTVGLLALLGLMALAGGIALVARPDGSVMHLPTAYLDGSPFPDFLVPGLILGSLFGVGSLAVAAISLRTWRIAPFLAFALGCGQMIWITVELAIIREVSFLHPLCFGIGLAIAVFSARWGWPTYRAWRDICG
jgi:hypothetical protein